MDARGGFEELGFTELTEERPPSRIPRPLKRRAARRIVLISVLSVVLASSLVTLGASIVAPAQTKQIVGETTTALAHQANEAVGRAPQVVLGGDGGQSLVDSCPGYWVHMDGYEAGGIRPPVYSAHNGCWGDGYGSVILPLGLGDTLMVTKDGIAQKYRVTELKDTPQHTSTTDDIANLRGALILQTCYWDGRTMKFVALEPEAA